MTTKRKAKPRKQAGNRRKDASPLNGIVPPVEHRFQPGQPSPNPHGRPRKLRELQELIKDVMSENVTPDMTRIMAAIKLGLNKNPTVWLEYAFGKMPTPTRVMNDDEWKGWLLENGYTDADIDSLAEEFASFISDRRTGARDPLEPPRSIFASIAPRPMADSDPSGEGETDSDGPTLGENDNGG